jgi:hypothetical protein
MRRRVLSCHLISAALREYPPWARPKTQGHRSLGRCPLGWEIEGEGGDFCCQPGMPLAGFLHPGESGNAYIHAAAKAGKTAFACQPIRHSADLGHRVGFVSTEQPPEQIILRLTLARTRHTMRTLCDPNCPLDDRFRDAFMQKGTLTITYCDGPPTWSACVIPSGSK